MFAFGVFIIIFKFENSDKYREQDDEVIQYTSEVSHIIESQYQLYYKSDIYFWGSAPDPAFVAWPLTVCYQ